MSEAMQGLLSDAKGGKYSSIKSNLSEEDVASVWENVSGFISKQMSQQKGVNISGLGTFTFSQKKLDIGNNKFLLIQRPVFNIAEKFAQTHGLQTSKHYVPGQIPVVPLNYSALSFESPFDRDTVESCVKELLNAVTRAVGAKKNVELLFSGIGRLSIREMKVKMKFFKEFITEMDGSGRLMESLQNRPGTVDSVMSERSLSRAGSSNTLILPNNRRPRIPSNYQSQPVGLAPVTEEVTQEDNDARHFAEELAKQLYPEPCIQLPDKELDQEDVGDVYTACAIDNILNEGIAVAEPFEFTVPQDIMTPEEPRKSVVIVSRATSRQAMPVSCVSGINLSEELSPEMNTSSFPHLYSEPRPHPLTAPASRPPHGYLEPIDRPATTESSGLAEKQKDSGDATCGHPNAGQELCYLCHQRARRNIPVSFTEERQRREEEEEKLLQQYQTMKDAEQTLTDHEKHVGKRQDLQKMAAFNLGVAEASNFKKKAKDKSFHRSYIFQRRPLTPPRFPKQEEYFKELTKQADAKDSVKQKEKSDIAFLERLEQVQLAEDLAAQREQHLKDKADQREMIKKGLETQLRFKPLPIPAYEKDDEIFGKNDMTNEKMQERRQRAFELFKSQQDYVAQRKRETILKRLSEQKEEEQVLARTKKELLEDHANRFSMRVHARKHLEDDWSKTVKMKRAREAEDHLLRLSPGHLVHEQCDKYHRCHQCKRKLNNHGESNIWSESRYIPGSRLMV